MIRWIASDLDGTLLRFDHTLDPATIAELKKQEARGVQFAAVTGREYASVKPLFANSGLHPLLILLNGSQVRDEHGKVLKFCSLSQAQVLAVGKILAKYGVVWHLYSNDGLASLFDVEENLVSFVRSAKADGFCPMDTDGEEYRDFYTGLKVYDSLEALVKQEPVVLKIEVHDTDRELLKRISEEVGVIEGLAASTSMPINIEITHAQAQKGPMLMRVIKEYGVDEQEVMVLGDSANDVTMLEMFTHSFAVANAAECAKQAARYQTASNDELGVVKAIHKLCE